VPLAQESAERFFKRRHVRTLNKLSAITALPDDLVSVRHHPGAVTRYRR
jgi:hypothetical protein